MSPERRIRKQEARGKQIVPVGGDPGNAEQRIRKQTEGWFITDPLLFSVWTLHRLTASKEIHTLRVGDGRIEYNPAFIQSLSDRDLREVLRLEAVRILLKHPYARRKPIPSLAYLASNITLREYIPTHLPLPRAQDIFKTQAYNHQYYELYYERLLERASAGAPSDAGAPGSTGTPTGAPGSASTPTNAPGPASTPTNAPGPTGTPASTSTGAKPPAATSPNGNAPAGTDTAPGPEGDQAPSRDHSLERYVDAGASGSENTQRWHHDEFQVEEINERIREAQQSDSWGTLTGRLQSVILATLVPKVNYRKMLRSFRASIVRSRRILTRMEPSRRYDFEYMGHRFGFSTRLLFAVDVSGSISDEDLRRGYSVVNQLFRYGIEQIDTLQFDVEIQGELLEFKKARKSIRITGRGGTSFDAVLNYIDEHRGYDGLIIFTDGYAPVPPRPANRRTRVVWLFNTEDNYRRMEARVRHIGKAAFIRESS